MIKLIGFTFKIDDEEVFVDVHFEEKSIWLALEQMEVVLDRNKSSISRHIKNIPENGK